MRCEKSKWPPLNVAKMMISVYDMKENIVEKGENACSLNAGQQHFLLFSSTGGKPVSYCHGIVSVVRASVRLCIRKLCIKKTSQKLLTAFLPNFTGMFLRCCSFKFLRIIVFHEEFWLPWQSK